MGEPVFEKKVIGNEAQRKWNGDESVEENSPFKEEEEKETISSIFGSFC